MMFETLPQAFYHYLLYHRSNLFSRWSFQQHLKDLRAGGQDYVAVLRGELGGTLGLRVDKKAREAADLLR